MYFYSCCSIGVHIGTCTTRRIDPFCGWSVSTTRSNWLSLSGSPTFSTPSVPKSRLTLFSYQFFSVFSTKHYIYSLRALIWWSSDNHANNYACCCACECARRSPASFDHVQGQAFSSSHDQTKSPLINRHQAASGTYKITCLCLSYLEEFFCEWLIDVAFITS
jgi:hypothetical protein